MSTCLDSLLDPERRAECDRNDVAMRTITHAHLMGTTRKYPRSLSEAFPDVRAQAIEYHVAPSVWKRIGRAVWRWL